jgi:simple sugar transport system ATP-binding protein
MEMATKRMLSHLGVRLPDLHLLVGWLSGGQQQPVAIVRALTFSQGVVLADLETRSTTMSGVVSAIVGAKG